MSINLALGVVFYHNSSLYHGRGPHSRTIVGPPKNSHPGLLQGEN